VAKIEGIIIICGENRGEKILGSKPKKIKSNYRNRIFDKKAH
jgi:hypothetical protein